MEQSGIAGSSVPKVNLWPACCERMMLIHPHRFVILYRLGYNRVQGNEKLRVILTEPAGHSSRYNDLDAKGFVQPSNIVLLHDDI